MTATVSSAPARDARTDLGWSVAWRMLAGTAAGAVAGFLVGGIGGRLAMLLLRLTSPDSVIGLTSDDGFEIGVVSLSTFSLLFATTVFGAIAGVLYATLRCSVPFRLRVPLSAAFWALFGGALLVNDDGVDFTALEPAWLAIALFVLLPGAGGAVLAILAERWSAAPPWQSRRLTVGLIVAAAAGAIAVALAIVAGAVVLAVTAALERLGARAEPVRRAGLVLVPLLLGAIALVAAIQLVRVSADILG